MEADLLVQRPWLWLRHAGVDDATAGHVDIRLACPLDDRIVAHDVKAKHHQHQGPRSHGILAACPLINPRALSSKPHRDAKSTSRDAASRCQVDESRCRIEIPSSTRPTNRRHSNRVPPEMFCLSNPTTVGNDSVAFVPSWPRRCHPLRGVLPRRAPAPSGVEVHL